MQDMSVRLGVAQKAVSTVKDMIAQLGVDLQRNAAIADARTWERWRQLVDDLAGAASEARKVLPR